MPHFGEDHQFCMRDASHDLDAVAGGREQVRLPHHDQEVDVGQCIQRLGLVVLLQGGEQIGQDVDRRSRDEVGDEAGPLGRHGRAERIRAGDHEAQVRGGPAGVIDEGGHGATGDNGRADRRCDAVSEARNGPRQTEVDIGDPARGRRQQRDAAHDRAEQFGALCRQRHDRHAAHRVADQDDRAIWGDSVEHTAEVLTQALDRRPGRSARAAAVAALVPQHDPGDVRDLGTLVRPGVQGQGVAVREDHRRRCGIGTPGDLHMEGHPVIGHDLEGLRGRLDAERRHRLTLLEPHHPAGDRALHEGADGHARSEDPEADEALGGSPHAVPPT